MTESQVLDLVRAAFIIAAEMSAPTLLVALGLGLIIGFFQALTSIQETTLTFVPKMIGMGIMLWVSLDSMSLALGDFFKGPILDAIVRS
jgi:flagellar biosynthesis protein FliQ